MYRVSWPFSNLHNKRVQGSTYIAAACVHPAKITNTSLPDNAAVAVVRETSQCSTGTCCRRVLLVVLHGRGEGGGGSPASLQIL